MKKILWTFVVAIGLAIALGAPAGAARLDYVDGKLPSTITTRLSAGTYDERTQSGYPETTVSFKQQNALASASASATGKVTPRATGLTIQFEVSAATLKIINDVFPIASSDPRAYAGVITYDIVPYLRYTVTPALPPKTWATSCRNTGLPVGLRRPSPPETNFPLPLPVVTFLSLLLGPPQNIRFIFRRRGPYPRV